MIYVALLTILFLQIIYQTCKGLTDGYLWYRHSWIEAYCIQHGWQNFYNGVEGHYWNYWHTFDSIRNMAEVASFVVALFTALFVHPLLEWGEILLYGLLLYWMPVFSIVYHNIIGKDKTIKQILLNSIFIKV